MDINVWNNIEYVTRIINESTTRFEVISKLGRSPTSYMYRRLKVFEMEHKINTSHFNSTNTVLRKQKSDNSRTLTFDDIFCVGSSVSSGIVKKRILRDGLLPYICSNCNNIGQWNNNSLTLQLEHIDGNHMNNTLSNLCFLCPNCHSQTKTYCGRNKERSTRKTVSRLEYKQQIAEICYNQNKPLIDLVLQSDIDFTKRGWSKKIALLIGKHPQKVKYWMIRYLPELYKNISK